MHKLCDTTVVRVQAGAITKYATWKTLVNEFLGDLGADKQIREALESSGILHYGGHGGLPNVIYQLAERREKVHEGDNCVYYYWPDGLGVVYEEDDDEIHLLPPWQDD